MPAKSESDRHSLAASLKPLLHTRDDKLSLGEIVDHIEGGEGPGPVLFALTLPVLLPLPPGFSMVLALPLLFVAPQIVVGRKRLWLPKMLSRQTVKRPALAKLVHKVLPILERVEKVVKPRLRFLTGRIGACAVGLACTLIALILVLPIPFANLVPALALGVFALGLTRRDGLLVLGGYGLLGLAAVVISLGVQGFSLGWGHLRSLL